MSKLEEMKARVEGHTEGPWEVRSDTHEYRGGRFVQVEPKIGSRTICDVTDQHRANAELIAAAPKLIAALEAVGAVAQHLEATYPSGAIWSTRIHAAITEALQ